MLWLKIVLILFQVNQALYKGDKSSILDRDLIQQDMQVSIACRISVHFKS